MSWRISLFFACSLSLVLTIGCGKKDAETSEAPKTGMSEGPSKETSKTVSVAAAKSTNVASPAISGSDAPSADSSPQEVCERFMKLLQSGNRIGAENLFTRTALTTTTKAGLKLEPMGGPTSTYRIGEVRYATSHKRLAQVDCFIADKDESGKEYEMEMTWQLHKVSTGFRISGVMLQLGEGKTKDLLSLENQYDVAKLQSLAGADVLDEPAGAEDSDEPNSRQAKALDSSIK